MKTKKKMKNKDKTSKKEEDLEEENSEKEDSEKESSEKEDSKKENSEEENNKNKPIIQKVHIYNNNRHLQKSSSAGNFSLFFEPYYSELKNSRKNNLFKSKPQNKVILEVEYIDLPKINNNILQKKLSEKEKKEAEKNK